MKNVIMTVIMIIGFSSCKSSTEFSGTLDVQRPIELNKGKETIYPGSYKTKLKAKKDKVKISLYKNDERVKKVSIKLPKDFVLPTNGSFSLSGDQINENLRIEGFIATNEIQVGGLFEELVDCGRMECWGSGPYGEPSCTYIPLISRFSYYKYEVNQLINLTFTNESENLRSSTYKGINNFERKEVISGTDACF